MEVFLKLFYDNCDYALVFFFFLLANPFISFLYIFFTLSLLHLLSIGHQLSNLLLYHVYNLLFSMCPIYHHFCCFSTSIISFNLVCSQIHVISFLSQSDPKYFSKLSSKLCSSQFFSSDFVRLLLYMIFLW